MATDITHKRRVKLERQKQSSRRNAERVAQRVLKDLNESVVQPSEPKKKGKRDKRLIERGVMTPPLRSVGEKNADRGFIYVREPIANDTKSRSALLYGGFETNRKRH